MDDKNKAIRELQEKIEELSRQHKLFQTEIQKLQNEIFELSYSSRSEVNVQVSPEPAKPEPVNVVSSAPVEVKTSVQTPPAQIATPPKPALRKKEKTPLE